MFDWTDKKAKEILSEYAQYGHTEQWLLDVISAAFRQVAAEARQRENEKCRELIEKRIDSSK